MVGRGRTGVKIAAEMCFTMATVVTCQATVDKPWGDGMGKCEFRDCRGSRARFLNWIKSWHGSHSVDLRPSKP